MLFRVQLNYRCSSGMLSTSGSCVSQLLLLLYYEYLHILGNAVSIIFCWYFKVHLCVKVLHHLVPPMGGSHVGECVADPVVQAWARTRQLRLAACHIKCRRRPLSKRVSIIHTVFRGGKKRVCVSVCVDVVAHSPCSKRVPLCHQFAASQAADERRILSRGGRVHFTANHVSSRGMKGLYLRRRRLHVAFVLATSKV